VEAGAGSGTTNLPDQGDGFVRKPSIFAIELAWVLEQRSVLLMSWKNLGAGERGQSIARLPHFRGKLKSYCTHIKGECLPWRRASHLSPACLTAVLMMLVMLMLVRMGLGRMNVLM